MCFNPSPVRRVPSPNRYMAVARFCFCKNNKRTINRSTQICLSEWCLQNTSAYPAMREGRYNRKILQSQLTELLQAYDGGWGAAEASPGYLSVCWLFIFKVTEPNSIL
jgi:hypothetical protein